MTMAQRRVLIVGGIFSGVSAASTLPRTGWSVKLTERSSEWRTDGGGITVGGPTLRALDTLGVLASFSPKARGATGRTFSGPTAHPVAISHPRLVSPDLCENDAIMLPLLGRILADFAIRSGCSQTEAPSAMTSLSASTEFTQPRGTKCSSRFRGRCLAVRAHGMPS